MRSAGIEGFNMDGKTGPSGDSHRLLGWAGDTHGSAAQHALAEALFAAYFARGQPLCDREVLLEAAKQAGLPADEAAAVLAQDASSASAKELQEELRLGRQLGVSGVPFFRITDGQRTVTLSGAKPPEVIADALRQVMPQQGADATVCGPGGCV
jgi:predicted DsbA family dithiol-disulfide isomerase